MDGWRTEEVMAAGGTLDMNGFVWLRKPIAVKRWLIPRNVYLGDVVSLDTGVRLYAEARCR